MIGGSKSRLNPSPRPCENESHEGLKNTQQHLRLFDNLTFIDGNSDYGHFVAMHIGKSQTHKVIDNHPQWFKE